MCVCRDRKIKKKIKICIFFIFIIKLQSRQFQNMCNVYSSYE